MFKIVRTTRVNTPPKLDNLLLAFGVVGTMMFLATILTYQDFFLFNPFDSLDPVRKLFLLFTTVGWVISLIGPVTILAMNALGKKHAVGLLPLVALAWPASLVLNHLALLVQTRNLYVGYLAVYPIFFVTDIALPITYVMIAKLLKHNKH